MSIFNRELMVGSEFCFMLESTDREDSEKSIYFKSTMILRSKYNTLRQTEGGQFMVMSWAT